MTISIICGILVVVCLLAVGLAVLAHRDGEDDTRAMAIGTAVVAGLVAVIVFTIGSYNRVDARAVGIVTGPGGYVDTVGPGVEWEPAWNDVEDWSTRNQTVRFAGDGKGEERDNFFTEPRITVRLGNQSEAYVDATITWRITEKSVENLWKQHKTFTDARQDFVTPTAQGATNSVFDGYDPLGAIDDASADVAVIPLKEWSDRLTRELAPLYAKRFVELVQVQVTYIRYDKQTEDKLRQYADEKANTRIAEQKAKTAEEEAKATKARNDPSLVQPGCEALIRDLAAMDQLKNLPDGWQCPGFTGSLIVGGTGGNVRRE